ncbi:GrpB family protein [Chitinophaga nivalis]|uniref:GrpB family protein n=1 Tax=Chitinophaga nivalis TaxID=2991709 RepID=A0ABT3IRA9_9BACT|nr:GrpB family protein [Chitinophaga nivalis]MCW3463814.1 GrpB family protein [Chitinophaga nivalis]MCW3486496.1 GrpB family protein [Chitinophaga nivalis]
MQALITIVPYRPEWPEEFRTIAQQLQTLLGPAALAIDHIGSTSVPGLAAKDVIDIQVTVASLEEPALAQLPQLGFERLWHITGDHRPPGRDDLPEADLKKQFYRKTERSVNLHIRVTGTFNQRYPLLCRDYLRSHPYAAKAYGEIKQQLARYFPDNADAYYDIKDPVFDIIMEGAYAWAVAENK